MFLELYLGGHETVLQITSAGSKSADLMLFLFQLFITYARS